MEAAAGRWSLLDFTLEIVWVGSGTEHINNILWKKNRSPENVKLVWELRVRADSGLGGNQPFLSAITPGPAHKAISTDAV